jgi:hypothetical protein
MTKDLANLGETSARLQHLRRRGVAQAMSTHRWQFRPFTGTIDDCRDAISRERTRWAAQLGEHQLVFAPWSTPLQPRNDGFADVNG